MFAPKRKIGCGGAPKWLELAQNENYIKNILSKQDTFVVLMTLALAVSVIVVTAMIMTKGDKVIGPLGIMLGSLSTVGTMFGGSKLHLTSKRLVMEIKHKFAGEIRLDQIQAIQVSKKLVGGKLLVVPTAKGDSAIEVSLVKPYQFAEEIQQLSAAYNDGTENLETEAHKGGTR